MSQQFVANLIVDVKCQNPALSEEQFDFARDIGLIKTFDGIAV
jgi:hypothetical protein